MNKIVPKMKMKMFGTKSVCIKFMTKMTREMEGQEPNIYFLRVTI